MFFKSLTTNNLQIQAFNSIKHYQHKHFATDIISMSINLLPYSKALIQETTIKKYILLQKSNKLGIEFTLTLYKLNGYIEIYIRKKRTAEIKIMFVNPIKFNIIQKLKYINDCNENIIKALLFQFDFTIISYLREGCSCKNKKILSFIKTLLCKSKHILNVHIDTPEYFLVI
jgi:hypothetical protein